MDDSGFKAWLEFMPHAIEEWKETLPAELSSALDSTFGSLLVLERWLVEKFPSVEASDTAPLVLDGAARYFGEYVRERCSASWSFYEVPQVAGLTPLKAVRDTIRYRTCSSFVSQLERTNADITPDEKYEGFLAWKAANEFRISEWLAAMADLDLDRSVASLAELERWLLQSYASLSDSYSEYDQIDAATRYFGEVLIGTYGGRWDMEVHHKDSLTYGAPHLCGFERAGPPMPAHQVIYNALENRSGDYITWIAKNLET